MLIGLLLFSALFYQKEQDKLYAYIKAMLFMMTIIYASLEILSIINLISVLTCRILWLAVDILLLILFIKKVKWKKFVKEDLNLQGAFGWSGFLLVGIALISIFFALRTVPNNFDSMTYHLPRIMHWAQNGSVAHYASRVVRQITSPVLAEFINLHVYLLSGKKDIFFNLPQWGAFITNTFLVMGIARKLKCNRVTCRISGLLFMTMPIAFAESMTTQNDLLATMWYLALVYMLLDMYICDRLLLSEKMIEKTIAMSLCVAFGYLTKPSGMFLVLTFGVGLLIVCVKRKDALGNLVKLGCIAGGSVSIALMPELVRNFYTFHAFSDPSAGARQLVATLNIKYLFISFLKNFFFNVPNVYCGIAPLIEHGIYYIAYLLGVDINDPSIAEDGAVFAMNPIRDYHHDTAINPVIFWGCMACSIYFLILLIKRKLDKDRALYIILSISSMAVFCVCLRWERFIERYTITYLALFCPIIALLLNNLYETGKAKYGDMLMGVLIFVSLSELIHMIPYHYEESTWGGNRSVEYFHNWKEEKYGVYEEITLFIKSKEYSTVGLVISENSYEYPLWALLFETNVIMKAIDVENITAVYEDESFIPDCIFVDKEMGIEEYEYHGIKYVNASVGDDYTYLLIRQN